MGHDLDDQELEATKRKFYDKQKIINQLIKENNELKKEIQELKNENNEIWQHLPRLD